MLFNLIMVFLLFASQAYADTATSTIYNAFDTASLTLDSLGAINGIDSYTKTMLHGDGTNGSTTITDSAFIPKTWTANGSAQISTTSPKFGTGSILFNGSTDYVSTGNSSDFTLGTNNFTFDFWINFNSLPGSGQLQAVFSSLDSTAFNGFYMYVINSSGTYQVRFTGLNANVLTLNTGLANIITPVTGTWYHYAVTYDGTYIRQFWNGTMVSITAATGIIPSGGAVMIIGAEGYGGTISQYVNGKIDEFRFSNGIARWTANFVLPTSAYSSAQIPISQITLQNTNIQEAKFWIDGSDSNKIKIDDGTTTRLTVFNGNVGIGTTNPGVLLDVAGPVRLQAGLITQGISPTIGTGSGDCGTSPSVTGNDVSGTVTVGSGANGGQCTVTFSAAKSSTPNCMCQNSTTANLTRAANQSTTSFACTGTLTAGDKLVYWCPQ